MWLPRVMRHAPPPLNPTLSQTLRKHIFNNNRYGITDPLLRFPWGLWQFTNICFLLDVVLKWKSRNVRSSDRVGARDTSTSVTSLVTECGIKERCDPAVTMQRRAVVTTGCLLPQCLAAAGVQGRVPGYVDTRFQSVFSQRRRLVHKSSTYELKLWRCGANLFQYIIRLKVTSPLNYTLICGHGI